MAHSIRTTMYFYSGHHGAGQLVNRHSRTDALFRLPALLSRRRLRRRLGRRLGRCRGRRLGRRRAVRVANSLLHPPPPSPPRKTYLRERERERDDDNDNDDDNRSPSSSILSSKRPPNAPF